MLAKTRRVDQLGTQRLPRPQALPEHLLLKNGREDKTSTID